MKFLVTGGLGFIGSNFILYVLKKHPKIKIVNIDAELFGSNYKNLRDIKNNQNYEYVKGNINNKNLMDKLISKVDVVFNFDSKSEKCKYNFLVK